MFAARQRVECALFKRYIKTVPCIRKGKEGGMIELTSWQKQMRSKDAKIKKNCQADKSDVFMQKQDRFSFLLSDVHEQKDYTEGCQGTWADSVVQIHWG